jgi:GTP-dependent phosphoenolpyruvate carboxykinase
MLPINAMLKIFIGVMDLKEYNRICELLVEKGTFIRLNKEKHPNSFACFTDPSDVARVEDKTFINSRRKEDAGPTNNWMEPNAMKQILNGLWMGNVWQDIVCNSILYGAYRFSLRQVRRSVNRLRICSG